MAEEKKETIRARVILEVLGKPKEHVEKTIKLLIDKAKEYPDLSVLDEKLADIKPEGKTMFTTFVELDLVTKGINTLIGFCFDFMPSSVEIEKPEQMLLKNQDISDIFNDLQSKLHNVDMVAKKLRQERDFIMRNMNTMVSNLIIVLIKINKNSLEDLSKFTGINKEELEKHMEKLIQEGKIKKEEDKYYVS
jgi:biotin operon repressor